MSYTGGGGLDTSLTTPSRSRRRTLAGIQSKVTDRSNQNAISRAFHAKSDSQMIASWKMDLNRILLIFNVRSVVLEWSTLIVHSQAELGISIRETLSEVRDRLTKIRVF